jgi:serine protease AprX
MADPERRRRLSARIHSKEEREAAVSIFKKADPDVHIYDGIVTGWGTRDTLRELMERHLLVDSSSFQKTDPQPAPVVATLPTVLGAGVGMSLNADDLIRELAPTTSSGLEIGLTRAVGDDSVDTRGLRKYVLAFMTGLLARVPDLVLGAAASILRRPAMDPSRTMYEVQLVGPMRPEWAAKLDSYKAAITSYVPPFRYRMFLTDSQLKVIQGLNFVHSATRYDLNATIGVSLLRQLQESRDTKEPKVVTLDLMVHYPSRVSSIRKILERRPGVTVVDVSESAIRFQASIADRFLISLADREEVKTLDIYTPPSLLLDFCRQQIGVTAINQARAVPWDGAGEIVGVVDSGIDQNHSDLSDKIASYQQIPGATPTDKFGHGTHVAGVIAGTGKGSGGKITGVAPGARLTIVGIVNANGEPMFPTDLTEILTLATKDGAKIINLSIGRRNTNGVYDLYSQSIDAFVYNNPEVLIVAAAGNDGTATSGYPDYQSINSPSSANNVITVGACGSTRSGIVRKWGAYDGARFPKPPASLADMTGTPVAPAGLSSRGPTQCRTLKPDVLAPGTFVLSAQAAGSTLQSYVPVPAGTGPYIFLNGTSMAAPFVSGAAAVLRQYLKMAMNMKRPTAALLKAILCASVIPCQQIVKPNANIGYPDFDQGFGMVNLATVIPHIDDQKRRMALADAPNKSDDALASRQSPASKTRSSRSYHVTISENPGPLQVVLTWTDPPGPYVKNVLLLDVQGPNNIALVGNHEFNYTHSNLFNTMNLQGIPYDTQNNIQIVRIPNPAPGEYSVNVLAYNTFVPSQPQGYAVCVCGNLASDLTPVQPLF